MRSDTLRRLGRATAIAVFTAAFAAAAAPPDTGRAAAVSPLLRERAQQPDAVITAIATYREPSVTGAPTASIRVPGSAERNRWIAATADDLAGALVPAGVEVVRRYTRLPMLGLRFPARLLDTVAADPRIAALSPVLTAHATRIDGNALMHVPAVHDLGYTGTGIGIAVLDTGVDYTQTELAPAGVKTIKLWDAIDNDDDPMDEGTSSHGTKVAAIAAGSGNGVAPDATVVAVRVLDSAGDGNSLDIVDGLDKVLASVTGGNPYTIRVANLSIGGYAGADWPPKSGNCDLLDYSTRRAFQDLTAAGVLVVVAAGNGGCTTGIAWPACISSAMAIGAVYDAAGYTLSFSAGQCQTSGCEDTMAADKIACYSDSGDQLSVWAPSHCASVPTRFGTTDPCFGGTSAAAPYVSGVAALMAQATATDPATIRSALQSSGRPLADLRNNVVRRRVDAQQALLQLSGSCVDVGTPADLGVTGPDPCGSQQSFTVAWDPVNGATSYLVQVSPQATFTTVDELLTTETTLTYAFDAAEDASFHVRVQALNGCSTSPYSTPTVVDYTVGCAPDAGTDVVVTGIAHTPGFAPAYWYSDLAVINPSQSQTAQLSLTFHGAGSTLTASASLGPLQQVMWVDVLPALFGLGGTDVGVVRIESTTPVEALARTYSRSAPDAPSYGQAYPGVPVSAALSSTAVGVLPNLRGDAPFYTNIELVNVGDTQATVQVGFKSGSGAQIGTIVNSTLDPFERTALLKAVPADTSNAFAEVRVLTPGGRAIAFASVVDDLSKDPTTIPMAELIGDAGASSGTSHVTGIAHWPGYDPAFWYSDVSVLNTSASDSDLTLTFHGRTQVLTETVSLPGESQVVWRDVVRSLFAVDGDDVGYVTVDSSTTAAVLARTYSRTSTVSPTYGQAYEGATDAEAMAPGQAAFLPSLRSDSPYYTNVELVNVDTADAAVRVRFYTSGGTLLSDATVAVPALHRTALNRALPSGTSGAYARIEIVGTAGAVLATASVVDDLSRDPTTIPMLVVTPQA